MRKRQMCALAAVAGMAVLATVALWPGITEKHYEILSDQVKQGETITVVVVSDLHSAVFGEGQKELLTHISEAKPDVILCAGDMVDDMEPQEGAWTFFAGVVDIAPTYYVSGNHEWWSGEMAEIKQHIAGLGVQVLEAGSQSLSLEEGTLVIGGVDDPVREAYDPGWSWTEAVKQTAEEMEKQEGVRIFISHRPERYQAYSNLGLDVVVSGHAHGGQVRVPLVLNGLFAPDQGFFPQRAGGLYTDMDYTHVVCRGTGHTWKLPRVFNPPEMVVLDFTGA